MALSNQGWIYEEVTQATGVTLLDYYTARYQHSSREEWRDRIESGLISVDQQFVTHSQFVLRSGQLLAYHRPPWVEPEVPLHVSVLHEDEELLVLHKPAGLPVLPGGGFLNNTLWGWLRRNYSQPPTPMHRLGRGTSGVMLMAKTEAAKSALSQGFRNREIHKVYRALAMGRVQLDEFTVTVPIGKVPHATLGYLYAATDQGKPAISHCRVLQRVGADCIGNQISNTTLLEVAIPTGRPHQIRIHLAAAGYPLWGDPLYTVGGSALHNSEKTGQTPVPGDCGYYLHAHQVTLRHPTQGYSLTVIAEPPAVLS